MRTLDWIPDLCQELLDDLLEAGVLSARKPCGDDLAEARTVRLE
jgi:hypothetical protein